MLRENAPCVECIDKSLCFLLKHRSIIVRPYCILLLKPYFVIWQGQPCSHATNVQLNVWNQNWPLCTSIHRMRDTHGCYIKSFRRFSKNVLEYTNIVLILHFLPIFLFIQQFFLYTLFLISLVYMTVPTVLIILRWNFSNQIVWYLWVSKNWLLKKKLKDISVMWPHICASRPHKLDLRLGANAIDISYGIVTSPPKYRNGATFYI